jgi:hypothetical protein
MTVHWDFAKTYSELERLFDDFRGDGAWAQNVVGRLGKGLGVDVEKDLVGALEGRVTLATWMQKPARLNSQTTLIGVKLKDAEASRPVFEKIVALAGQEWAEQNYAGVKYYCIRQRRTPPNFNTEIMRLPDPSVAILGDYLILTDSSEFLQRAIATSKGSPPPLSEELDFKLIASKISRQVGGDKPSMISFGRPEETLRTFYDLATSDATRGRLAKQAERNPLLRMLHQAMSEHPLPPFSVLAKYFAPTGGLLTTDQIGIHSMGFTLKRD